MAAEASPLLGLYVLLTLGVVGLIVAGAWLPRRRTHRVVIVSLVPPPAHSTLLVSPDGRYWWDGTAWMDAACVAPAGAVCSPDGSSWWSGAEWLPRPAALPASPAPADEPPWWERVRSAQPS